MNFKKETGVLVTLVMAVAFCFLYQFYPALNKHMVYISKLAGCLNSTCISKEVVDVQTLLHEAPNVTNIDEGNRTDLQNGSTLPECQSNNDNVWTFKCGVQCPERIFTTNTIHRKQLVIICRGVKSKVIKMIVDNMRIVPKIDYGSKCLEDVASNYCHSDQPVPNIVHYIWFSKRELSFYHFLSILSVHKILKPCLILIHGDVQPYGIYWQYLLQIVPNIIHVFRKQLKSIYGIKIDRVEHRSDVARLQALQLYGGIYLDTDELILRPMDELRKYKFTLSHELDSNLANGLILSEKNSRFLSIWLNGYKKFYNDQWAYFSTILPYELYKRYPNLIHVEDKTFVKPDYTQIPMFLKHNFNWSKNYAIHLYTRFYNGMTYDFESVRQLNTTIGSLSRYLLYGSKELCLQ